MPTSCPPVPHHRKADLPSFVSMASAAAAGKVVLLVGHMDASNESMEKALSDVKAVAASCRLEMLDRLGSGMGARLRVWFLARPDSVLVALPTSSFDAVILIGAPGVRLGSSSSNVLGLLLKALKPSGTLTGSVSSIAGGEDVESLVKLAGFVDATLSADGIVRSFSNGPTLNGASAVGEQAGLRGGHGLPAQPQA